MEMPRGRLELSWMGKDQALIPSERGKYDYEWVDPSDPRACEVKPIVVGKAYGEDVDRNLLIAGDSGDALRTLVSAPEWADKYRGKVKLVYIDPPFNTEQTFEHYADALEHSVWLTLMRDRLVYIKELLADKGTVWVHLDDSELHRMRSVLDEVFGADNFIASVVWEKADSPNNSAMYLSIDQDTILVYGKNKRSWKPNKLPRTAALDSIYTNPDDDPRGRWYPGDPFANKPYSLGKFEVEGPTGRTFQPPAGRYWRTSEARFRSLDADGRIWWGPSGDARPSIKRYLNDVSGAVPRTLWRHSEVGSNRTSKNEIRSLFPGVSSFATPKPELLLQRVISIASDPDDIVLDCFAGSGTTAAVAHKLRRRWIAVELQQSTIDQFTMPRLVKVVDGEDQGGISRTTERVTVSDLPEGVTPEDAQVFSRLLGKFADTTGADPTSVKALRAAAKTKENTKVLWTGGGGFTTASVSPSMYEIIDDEVYLSEAATNGAFSKAVAGQLRYRLTEDDPVFCGEKGRSRLAVIDGVADENVVRTVLQSLGAGYKALIVAKGVLPEAAELLYELSPGSRIRRAPDDLFAKGTVK